MARVFQDQVTEFEIETTVSCYFFKLRAFSRTYPKVLPCETTVVDSKGFCSFFWPCHVTDGILAPQPGIELRSMAF